MKHDNRNLILAAVLSMVVIFGWQFFVMEPRLVEEQAQAETLEATAKAEQDAMKAAGFGTSTVPTPPAALAASGGTPVVAPGRVQQNLPRDLALAQRPRIAIDTPSLRGSIALQGARLDDLQLKKYSQTIDPTSPEVVLFEPASSQKPYYAELGFTKSANSSTKTPTDSTIWSVDSGTTLTQDTPVVLSWDNGEGLVFRRTVSVDDNYLFTVTDVVENSTSEIVTLYPYGLLSRGTLPETQGIYVLHEGMIGWFSADGLQEVDYDEDFADEKFSFDSTGGWLGITDKYWAAALVPQQDKAYQATFSEDPNPRRTAFQADFLAEALNIPAGGAAQIENRIFAGAKVATLLTAYEEVDGVQKIGLLIDWGWFWFFTEPLFKALHLVADYVGNFGVAILIVTVVIKAFFFPLANRSYTAMSKMKKLQPKMEEVRARHKEDKAKQQEALMKLYKDEQVNPLAGCWPVLIQIPVFFALYKVLYVTIEMRQAPFFGWIHDLSEQDPTNIFNLFGLLPYDPSGFLMLGVWPIIMGFTMFVQQRMNPAPADPMQQKIFMWMPLFFMFILASFPAGLVIYWAWNNFLSVLQQGFIMRKNDVEIELFSNIGFDKLIAKFKK